MKNPLSKGLHWCLPGIYLVWSLLVYFSTLPYPGHEWWPVSLFPLILPWSAVYEYLIDPMLMKWLVPDPRSAPESAWMMLDYIAGAYYIIIGTIWFWIVGKVISRILRRREGLENEEPK
jgi:hypothetical protein